MSISYNPGVVDHSGEFTANGYMQGAQGLAGGITSAINSLDSLYKANGTLNLAKGFGLIDQSTIDALNQGRPGDVIGAAENISGLLSTVAANKRAEEDAKYKNAELALRQKALDMRAAGSAVKSQTTRYIPGQGYVPGNPIMGSVDSSSASSYSDPIVQ
jgi:hypothetical protein